jgi:hypothetical protein
VTRSSYLYRICRSPNNQRSPGHWLPVGRVSV